MGDGYETVSSPEDIEKARRILSRARSEVNYLDLKGPEAFEMLAAQTSHLATMMSNSSWSIKDDKAERYSDKYHDMVPDEIRKLSSSVLSLLDAMIILCKKGL